MTKLSVNINKIATLRNARGGTRPEVLKAALAAENFGAQGITVHPRPDERHITQQDVRDLAAHVKTEFNIEGYPTVDFLALVKEVKPAQVTLVPDSPEVLTSNQGWDCIKNQPFLTDICKQIHEWGGRVSVFLNPEINQLEAAKSCGADRIELYTESYAVNFPRSPIEAVKDYKATAIEANKIGLGINAGHDLDLNNLKYFAQEIPDLLEVSIGHALISDALYYGLNNAIQMYLRQLSAAKD
ncbi:MAG: pyridoxine 5'-phosphate synthase [Bacteroidia bacterium]